MTQWLLLGGPLAAFVFGVGVVWLGWTRPGYSAMRQTVSELGPLGDRGRRSLARLNLVIALCSLLFAGGLFLIAGRLGASAAPAWFVALYAVLAAGLAAFPAGHRLHNVFGLLQTVPFVGGPLSVALGWQRPEELARLSWIALLLLVVSMALNLAPAFSKRLGTAFAPVYGLLQRCIFVAWYGWFAILGVWLFSISHRI